MSNKRNSAVEMKTLETPLCIIKPSAGTNTCKEAILSYAYIACS